MDRNHGRYDQIHCRLPEIIVSSRAVGHAVLGVKSSEVKPSSDGRFDFTNLVDTLSTYVGLLSPLALRPCRCVKTSLT